MGHHLTLFVTCQRRCPRGCGGLTPLRAIPSFSPRVHEGGAMKTWESSKGYLAFTEEPSPRYRKAGLWWKLGAACAGAMALLGCGGSDSNADGDADGDFGDDVPGGGGDLTATQTATGTGDGTNTATGTRT